MEQLLLCNKIGIRMLFNLLLYWNSLLFIRDCRQFGIWYAHAMIMAYLLTKKIEPTICYADRGWTHFERSCSELIKPSNCGGIRELWNMTVEISDDGRSQA